MFESVEIGRTLSKKAYKRAVGRLLKSGSVRIDDDGTVTLASDP